MAARKWFIVAKNEYRTRINSVRKIRRLFPYLVIGLLAIYVAFIAPAFVNLFVDDLIAFFLSQVALAMVPIIMFLFFLYLLIFPITYTLQGMQAGQVEIFVAAPIKPSDILLGEFIGVMPFYAIAIAVIAGFFTAALSPLGLDVIQMLITVMIFVVTLLSGLWIGTVISALIRTRFAESARGRDIGRALSLVLALPMIAVIYAIIGGGFLDALRNPETGGMIRTVLQVLPSTWGAELIVDFAANPGNIGAVAFETVTRLGGLLAFFASALWLGAKAAGRAYSIEITTFTTSRAKPDGTFYKTVRYLGGGKSFGTLLVSIFKDFARKLENLSRIAYILGLFVMLNVFFLRDLDPEGFLVIAQFLFPFLAVFMIGQVAVHGKEGLFIYKKAPQGVRRFVLAKLVQGWLVTVPVAAAITVVSLALVPQASATSLMAYTLLTTILVAADAALALGLALLNPQFSESSRAQMASLMLNANIAMFASMGIFIGSMIILDLGIFNTMLLQNGVIWTIGISLLLLGRRKLNRME